MDYDPDTGVFRWKRRDGHHMDGWNGRCAGKVATQPDGRGYVRVLHYGKQYRAHRLAWLWVYGAMPEVTIDHINGVRSDNRICNLRLANGHQQKANRGVSIANTSGFKGVSFNVAGKKWRAKITSNGVEYRLGSFATKEDAYKAYCAAAIKLHGEFARLN